MRRLLRCIALAGLGVVLVFGLVGPALAGPEEKMVRVLIGFHRSPGLVRLQVVEEAGGRVTHVYHRVPVLSATLTQEAIDALRGDANVAFIEEDSAVWATEEQLPWGIDRIDAELVHPYNRGTGVKIAVIDSGIDLDHPDLQVAGGVTLTSGPSGGDDDYGHGTHVAGILSALDNRCPLCQGAGVLSPDQMRHWRDLEADHSVEECEHCRELRLVCSR